MSSKNNKEDKFKEVRINMMVCISDIQQLFASIYNAIAEMSPEEIDKFAQECKEEKFRGIGFLEWQDIREIAVRVGQIMNIMCIDDPLFAAREILKTEEGEEYVKKGIVPFKGYLREARSKGRKWRDN